MLMIIAGILTLISIGFLAVADDLKFIGVIGIVISFVMAIGSTITIVDAGNVGVVEVFGDVEPEPLQPGLSFVNPFASVTEMSTRTISMTMSSSADGGNNDVTALSKDLLDMPTDVTFFYTVNGKLAPELYKSFGGDGVIANGLVKPSARTGVRDGAAQFTANEAFTEKRAQLGPKFLENANISLNKLLDEKGIDANAITIVDFQVRKIEPPRAIKQAIEEKMAEQQRAEKMQYTNNHARLEAKRKEIEAGGIKKFQDIVSKGISPQLLQWKGIEATLKLAQSPNAKVVVIGSGKDGMPIILNSGQATTLTSAQ